MRGGRKGFTAVATLAVATGCGCGLALWVWLMPGRSEAFMRMPVADVLVGNSRASFPGVPGGYVSKAPSPVAESGAPRPGSPSRPTQTNPDTRPAVSGDASLVPFPAQVGLDLAAMGPRFGVDMPQPDYVWSVIGALPPGFGPVAYDAYNRFWSFTGTPTREGVYRISLSSAKRYGKPVVVSTNLVVAPAEGGPPVAVGIQASSTAYVGQPLGDQAALHGYLLPIGLPCASWEVTTGVLPDGVTLVPGCLPPGSAMMDVASMPTTSGVSTFTLTGTAPDGTVATTGEIPFEVRDPVLDLRLDRIGPETADGRPVFYRPHAIFGVETYDRPGRDASGAGADVLAYDLEGDLPHGMHFDVSTGVVAGVPRRDASGSFRIVAKLTRPEGTEVFASTRTVTYQADEGASRPTQSSFVEAAPP